MFGRSLENLLTYALCSLLLGYVLSGAAFAQDTNNYDPQTEAATNAVMSLLTLNSFVEANVSFCAESAPETAEAVEAAADSWLTSSGLDMLAQLRNAPLEVSSTFSEIEASLRADALQTLSARATGKEAAWCQNFPALLQGDDWNVQTNYAGELAGLREFVTLVTGGAPLPQAQALSPMTSPSYAEIVAAGIDPKNQFIPDEFHCYDESGADYSRPHMVVQITGPGQYESSYGGGTFVLEADDSYAPDITWTSGPLTDAGGSLYFNDYGQTFSPYVSFGDTSVSYDCYQQGSSEGRALTVFRLKDPQAGTYQCQDVETGQTQPLELLPGSAYTLGGQRGTYGVTDLLEGGGGSSQINWLTGPLAEGDARYNEEEGTGYREIRMSTSENYSWFESSSTLSVVCSAVGEPVSSARYGDGVAPPVEGNEQPLSGFFYRGEYVSSGMTGSVQPAFYLFFPSGYVYTGDIEGDLADIDCARTKPNGTPFCDTYRISRNFITIGNNGPEAFSLENGVPVLEGEAMSPVVSGITTLDGHFWANYFYSVGVCIGEYAVCSSTYLEWEYLFTPDGRFEYTSSDQSMGSSNFGDMGGASYGGGGSEYNSGGYTITGNVIELRFDDGKVEKKFIMITDPEHFVMGSQSYSPKSED